MVPTTPPGACLPDEHGSISIALNFLNRTDVQICQAPEPLKSTVRAFGPKDSLRPDNPIADNRGLGASVKRGTSTSWQFT
jgi:hypothetical protein